MLTEYSYTSLQHQLIHTDRIPSKIANLANEFQSSIDQFSTGFQKSRETDPNFDFPVQKDLESTNKQVIKASKCPK